MEIQPVFEKSMANSLEIHGIRGKNERIHGIFTDGSAEYSVIHRFPAISTESNLLRINMRNRFTEGSLLRLNII